MTPEQAMDGFRAGRTLVVYRRDDPLLPWLLEQVRAGVLSQEYVEYDEQSSALKFRLAKEKS